MTLPESPDRASGPTATAHWFAEKKSLQQRSAVLYSRHRLLQALRGCFADKGFLEIETPVRIHAPATEEHIDAVRAGSGFLRTSPELHMKRLLAAGYGRIYQIGPCFRKAEKGTWHEPEFTMLEWYRRGANHDDLIPDIQDLTGAAAEAVAGSTHISYGNTTLDLTPPWKTMTVDEAFTRYARGHTVRSALDEGCFEETLTQEIEPHLGRQRPLILRDYPLELGGFARQYAHKPHQVQRWELYIGGIELANACTEITDITEQDSRFHRAANTRIRDQRTVYPDDSAFRGALSSGDLPPCAGIALGVDRLLMILSQAENIQQTRSFSV